MRQAVFLGEREWHLFTVTLQETLTSKRHQSFFWLMPVIYPFASNKLLFY